MNILLVEDEDSLASFVNKGLTAEGHHVERAATSAHAVSLAAGYEFDLVLLDLLLPDAHGSETLRRIREVRPDVAIIVVSAQGEIEDKVELLDLGANDYLVKPFAFAELAARVRASSRGPGSTRRELIAGNLRLDTRTRVATHGSRIVDLPSREFALLEYLMRHPGQVLTRQQILDAVWGIDFDTSSNVVDVYVGYLRRKLDIPGSASVIETMRGAGYRVRS